MTYASSGGPGRPKSLIASDLRALFLKLYIHCIIYADLSSRRVIYIFIYYLLICNSFICNLLISLLFISRSLIYNSLICILFIYHSLFRNYLFSLPYFVII